MGLRRIDRERGNSRAYILKGLKGAKMDEQQKKIESILHWALTKNFKLSPEEWKMFAERTDALSKEFQDEKFKEKLIATIDYVSKMSKI